MNLKKSNPMYLPEVLRSALASLEKCRACFKILFADDVLRDGLDFRYPYFCPDNCSPISYTSGLCQLDVWTSVGCPVVIGCLP